MEKQTKKLRGLANVSRERRLEIASLGGKASAAKKTSYRWNSETARLAVMAREAKKERGCQKRSR